MCTEQTCKQKTKGSIGIYPSWRSFGLPSTGKVDEKCRIQSYFPGLNEEIKDNQNDRYIHLKFLLRTSLQFDQELDTLLTSAKIVSYGDYVNGLRSRLQMAHDICRRYLAKTAKRRKDICDAKVCFKSYQPGDAVWYL
jgi:hypothetical protein